MNKIENILKFAMRMEKDAEDFYSFYQDKVKSPDTKKLFSDLIETERQHYEFIKTNYEEIGFEEPPITISWVVDRKNSAKDPHILSNNSILPVKDDEISDLAIVRMAYQIESDFAYFYKSAEASVSDSSSKKLLKKLSEWEEQHKEMFKSRYEALLKEYWNDVGSLMFSSK